MSRVVSTPDERERLARIIRCCCRLPISSDAVPGAFVEAVLAHVRGAQVLNTYDYVDVISSREQIGWSVKSTKSGTPLTWKRVKLPERQRMIEGSRGSAEGSQRLGDSILDFCNAHAAISFDKYGLDEIGYARLIVFPSGKVEYFERKLCDRRTPMIFEPRDFEWGWSVEKAAGKKEQLSALHGTHKPTGKRWWSWHGQGENQLHFTGEREWWPQNAGDKVSFDLPATVDRLSFDDLLAVLEKSWLRS